MSWLFTLSSLNWGWRCDSVSHRIEACVPVSSGGVEGGDGIGQPVNETQKSAVFFRMAFKVWPHTVALILHTPACLACVK